MHDVYIQVARGGPPGDSSVERAYRALRQEIVAGVHPPGTPLSESLLARALGVSRTPVREVLARLHHEGYLDRLAGRGYFVTQITVQLIHDTFAVRRLLEGAAAAQAATAATADEIARLRALATYAYTVEDASAFHRAQTANAAFHLGVAAAGRNVLAAELIRRCLEQMDRFVSLGVGHAAVQQGATSEHEAIVEAIRRRDPEAARQAMEAHLDRSTRVMKEALMSGAAPLVGIA